LAAIFAFVKFEKQFYFEFRTKTKCTRLQSIINLLSFDREKLKA